MIELTPDVVATLRLVPSDKGGRHSPIMASGFGCLFEHDGNVNDCRLLLEGTGDVWPGQQLTVPIKFLRPDLVRSRLRVGDSFRLFEGKVIAHGVIDEIVPEL
jgi:hypothetical protein